MSSKKKKKSSFLKILSLAILISEGDLHGYALYKKIIYHTQMKWVPSIGTVYRVLNEMAREGLVEKTSIGRKSLYRITDKGIEYYIENSIASVTKITGILATTLDAYLNILDRKPDIITRELRERLRILYNVLLKYKSKKLIVSSKEYLEN